MADFLVLPFVEIEIRLGTLGKFFDSSIDRQHFEKIKNELNTGSWVNILETNTVEYIKDSNRFITDSTNNVKLILKENVFTRTIQLPNNPFDIRFSVNQEFKLDSFLTSFSKNESIIRTKKRTSYISENFKYDLTIVQEKKNNINVNKHELEIELIVNSETLTWSTNYIQDFLECKVYDIVNMIEPIDRKQFKIILF